MKYNFFHRGNVSSIGKFVNRRFTRYFIGEILKHKKSGSVLEIGPGRGEAIDALNGYGFKCQWVDSDPSEHVKEKYRGKIARFPDQSPFIDERFDVIVASNVLEHMISPLEACSFVDQCKTMLNDDGVLALCVPDYHDYGEKFFTVPDHGYPTTRMGIDTLLSEVGFKKLSNYHIYGGIKGMPGRVAWFPLRAMISLLWFVLPDDIRYLRAFEKADQIYRGEYASIWRKDTVDEAEVEK